MNMRYMNSGLSQMRGQAADTGLSYGIPQTRNRTLPGSGEACTKKGKVAINTALPRGRNFHHSELNWSSILGPPGREASNDHAMRRSLVAE